MRRFLITSATVFTGEAEALYDDNGRLSRFDVLATDMPPVIVKYFKEKLPVMVEDLPTSFKDTVTIVETSYEVTFEMFWSKYDKKINRKRCEPIWNKQLSKADQVAAFYGVDGYNKFLKKEHWRPKADPEKYLKDKYWENEWK